MSKSLVDEILDAKIIAIVRGAEPAKCKAVVKALEAGGIRFVEITYNQSKPESWEETASIIGYSPSQTFKLHHAALALLPQPQGGNSTL